MSNFNPGNYYRNIDRYGSEIVNEGAPDFVPTPINYTPAASGNTQNINQFVIDPNGDMYFIDADGESFKINTNNPLDVLTTAQPTPTATGNTTNLNSVFVDTNGEYWVVDWKGDAIKVGPKDVVTTVTNTVTGNKIATYTNELGAVVDINETITVLGNLTYDPVTGLLTIPYTDEAGVVNNKTVTISQLNVLTTVQPTPSATGNTTNLNSAFVDASGNSWIVDSNGDAILTGTAVSISNVQALGNKIADITIGGVTTSIKETITSISAFSISGNTITLTYIDEAGATNTKTLDVPSDVITNITNTVTGHKIGTYTNESGVAVDINETITSVSDFSISGNTITLSYIDEAGVTNTETLNIPSDVVTTLTNTVTGNKIGTYTNELGVAVDINETITVLGNITYDAVTGLLSIPYTDEAGVVNTKTATIPSLNVLTTTQATPSPTGNTTNLNSVFKDGNNVTWIVDANGDAIQASSPETITTLTNTLATGKVIGTYTNEAGVAVDIKETITTLTKSGYVLTYTNEDGTVTTFDTTPLDVNLTIIGYTPTATGNTSNLNSLVIDPLGDIYVIDYQGDSKKLSIAQVLTTLTNTVTGHRIGTYTNENGVAVDINETITTLVNNNNDTFTYTNENGVTTIIDLTPYKDDRYKTTSTTCLDISQPGTKTLTVETGLAYTPLQDIIIYADASNYMIGEVVSYNSVTGVLVFDPKFKKGNGTFCSWTVNLDSIKLDAVSVYFGSQTPSAAGQVGIEGDSWFVTSDGTCNGTITEYWVYDSSCGWVKIPMSSPELVQFGTTAPTSTTGYTAGDEYFVTSNGTSTGTITAQYIFNGTTWTLRPTGATTLTTTSITPQVYNGTTFTGAQANAVANAADLLLLSDGQRIHTGEVTWTGHGLTVGKWYYLDQTAPGGITSTKPTSGIVQQLFFVEDANTIHVDIEEAWQYSSSPSYSQTVYVNATSPSSATIFDLNNPPTTNDNTLKANDSYIYVGTDGSMWTYNTSTSTYTTYSPTDVHLRFSFPSRSLTANVAQTLNTLTTIHNSYPSAWNNTTGTFTAPIAGYYLVAGELIVQASWTNSQFIYLDVLKNGVLDTRWFQQSPMSNSWQMTASGSNVVYLAAGNTIQFRIGSSVNGTSSTAAQGSYVTISKL